VGQPSAAWPPFSPPAGGAVISCTERTLTALSAEQLGQGGKRNAAGPRPAPPFLERQPQGRGRAFLRLSRPGSRSSLALPSLRPLSFFRAVLRAVRRQGAREALLPGDHRALVQPECRHDSLSWAAVRQQRHHRRHHRGRRPQPKERGPCRWAEGAPTRRTALASFLLTMDTDGPLPSQSPGAAVLVRAEYALRVHGVCSPGRGEQPRLCTACPTDPPSVSTPPPSRLNGVVPRSRQGSGRPDRRRLSMVTLMGRLPAILYPSDAQHAASASQPLTTRLFRAYHSAGLTLPRRPTREAPKRNG